MGREFFSFIDCLFELKKNSLCSFTVFSGRDFDWIEKGEKKKKEKKKKKKERRRRRRKKQEVGEEENEEERRKKKDRVLGMT